MWEHDLILLGEKKVTGHDVDGNPEFTRDETTILCTERSVTRDEFYLASQAGFKPRFTVLINPVEYEYQKLCRFRGETLLISRVYSPVDYKGQSLTELQLVERMGDD